MLASGAPLSHAVAPCSGESMKEGVCGGGAANYLASLVSTSLAELPAVDADFRRQPAPSSSPNSWRKMTSD